MARLNDLPPTESVESLKRRFIRQNREIARANSLQSARIRSLESEVTRLLSENVALRDEISWLNREAEKRQGSERFDNQLLSVKGKLEAKLAELSGLVVDLGTIPHKARQAAENTSSLRSPTAIKPTQNAAAIDEDRLPAILEDKHFPRLTPEIIPESPINDVQEDVNFDCLGSPPVLSFEVDSPSPFKLVKPIQSNDHLVSKLSGDDQTNNIETRRRRRDSSFLHDIIPQSEPLIGHDEKPRKLQLSRAGSKRKFTVQEDEEPNDNQDDFKYTRMNNEAAFDSENQSTPIISKETPQPVAKGRKVGRRALGPKSVNSNLRSPTKTDSSKHKLALEGKKSLTKAKEKPLSKFIAEELNISGFHKTDTVKHAIVDDAATPARVNIKLNKQATPGSASEFVISSGSNERNSVSQNSLLSQDAEASTRTRQTRRSRGPVSYAEPNLRDKMRRPTGDLADAVGEEKFRRTSRSQPETQHLSESISDSFNPPESTEVSDVLALQTEHPPPIVPDTTAAYAGESQPSPSQIALSSLVAGSKKRCPGKRKSEMRRYSSKVGTGNVEKRRNGLLTSLNNAEDDGIGSTEATGSMEDHVSAVDSNSSALAETGGHRVDITYLSRGPATRRRSMMV